MKINRLFTVSLSFGFLSGVASFSLKTTPLSSSSRHASSRSNDGGIVPQVSVSTASTTAASAAAVSNKVALRGGPTFKTWLRRLNTREDKFSMHKLSGLGFVVSSTVILVTGATHKFGNVPAFLQPVDMVLAVSTVTQCVTSIDMAINHRRSQPEVRDQFISMAMVILMSTSATEVFTPFAPKILCNKESTDFLFLCLCTLSTVFYVEGVRSKDKLLELRAAKSGKENNEAAVVPFIDTANYLIGVILPLIQVIMTFLVFIDPAHNRQWFLDYANERAGAACFYYMQVFANACFMYSALVVTLRDKKLIDQKLESNLLFALMFTSLVPVPLALLIG